MGAINVIVTYGSGRGQKGVRVVGEVGGFLGGMTSPVQTDSDGRAVVSWRSDVGTLAALYVGGRKHVGPFRSGQTYAFPAS
jgi:hypothetical protein